MISEPLYHSYRRTFKRAWPFYAYLLWESIGYGQRLMQAEVWSGALLSDGVQLGFEVVTLIGALGLIGLRSSGGHQRGRWIESYGKEIELLAPLFVWLILVLALRWPPSFSLETIGLTTSGVIYALWLLRANRREAAATSALEAFAQELDYPVTRLADEVAKLFGIRIDLGMPSELREEFKDKARENALRHISLYVHGDERALTLLEKLQRRFPGQPLSRLATHALYQLQNSYGAERFSVMMTALIDAYATTMEENRKAISDVTSQLMAKLESGNEHVDFSDIQKQLEPLNLRKQVQHAFRNAIVTRVGYDMSPETNSAHDKGSMAVSV